MKASQTTAKCSIVVNAFRVRHASVFVGSVYDMLQLVGEIPKTVSDTPTQGTAQGAQGERLPALSTS